MVIKEIHELRRDKVSISMVLLTPLFQLIILGYAINMDPHNLPTALLNYDTERMSQIFVTEAQNTGYFSMIPVDSEEAAQKAFVRGDVTFIVTIPEGFTRKLLRGEKPQLLIQGDAIESDHHGECAQRPCAGGEVDVSARFAGRHACGAKRG